MNGWETNERGDWLVTQVLTLRVFECSGGFAWSITNDEGGHMAECSEASTSRQMAREAATDAACELLDAARALLLAARAP